MAGFTAHIVLSPAGVKAPSLGTVGFLYVGAVALSTAGIPVLVGPGPVQRIPGGNHSVRVEVIPALPALALGPGVPGNGQCLQSALACWQQVLLQWIDPEHPGHGKFFQFALGVIGPNPVAAVLAEKRGRDLAIGEAGVIKVAKHGVRGDGLHGQVMV